LGQNPVNHVTNARRAAYIASRGDLRGDILVIGDDDATSVALATIGRSIRVTVVDYDTRVVDFLNDIASIGRLPLQATVRDVAGEFPADLEDSVDCVVCDPIPSKDGIESFLSFATRALRRDGVVYLSAIPTDAPNPADVHAAAWAAGMVATDMIPGLSQYPGNYGAEADRAAFGEDDRRGVEFSETWIRLVRARTPAQPSQT
jgi:predicted methyltransferase